MRPMTVADQSRDSLDTDSVEADIAEAERAGLKLAIKGRTVVLLPVALWIGVSGTFPGNFYGVSLVALFIALGLFHHWLISTGRARPVRVFAPVPA